MEKQLINWINYKVTDKGEVINIKTGRKLKPIKKTNGYMQVNLSMNGERKSIMIHQLIAEAFLNKPSDYGNGFIVINHIDGNKENNSLDNLEYTTQQDNVRKAFKMNLNKNKGYNHYKSLKLTDHKINKILILFERDYLYSEIAKIEGINQGTIRKIIENPSNYYKQ